MKKLAVLLMVVCLAALSVYGIRPAQDEAAAVGSFKAIAKRVDSFFSASPVALHSEAYEKYSPSGTINYLLKFEKIEASFDVQKTNSLISPYSAYIILKLRASSNAKFGDIRTRDYMEIEKEVFYNHGFQRAEDALKIKEFSSCSDPHYDEAEWCIGDIKLLYAFQDNTWVFKDAYLPDDSRIRDGSTARALRLMFLNNPEWRLMLSGKK